MIKIAILTAKYMISLGRIDKFLYPSKVIYSDNIKLYFSSLHFLSGLIAGKIFMLKLCFLSCNLNFYLNFNYYNILKVEAFGANLTVLIYSYFS